jgi:HYR domain.
VRATTRIFNRAVWRVVALLGLISTLPVPSVFAQHHDTAARAGLQTLTFARHVNTPFTLATAQTAMTNANTVIQTCDGTPNANEDIACQVTMQVAGGAIGTFGATGDGGDVILTDAAMTALINSGTANVMVVTAIGRCGGAGPAPGLTIIGCGNVGSQGIVSVNTLAGNLLGVEITHEFLHNQGHGHRGTAGEGPTTPGAILNPVLNLNSNIINQAECGSLHTGPSYTGADNGPIVDPPPTITCPADATVECTGPAGEQNTNAQIVAFLAGVTASDGCEPVPTITNNAPAVFPKGPTAVTFTATDADFLGATSSCTATVRVVDTTPPSITCPATIAVQCSQAGGVPASDPTIAAFLAGATATDICDPSPTISNNAPAFFSLGTTVVAFSATDADTNVSQCSATVTVKDTTPPVISALSASPNVLWPPNHKFVPVQVSVSATDTCDPNPTCVVASVASSEPVTGGGGCGNTSPDFVITGPLRVDLRAERCGTGPGRTYTITVNCTDHSNNSSQKPTAVTVPHDRR